MISFHFHSLRLNHSFTKRASRPRRRSCKSAQETIQLFHQGIRYFFRDKMTAWNFFAADVGSTLSPGVEHIIQLRPRAPGSPQNEKGTGDLVVQIGGVMDEVN